LDIILNILCKIKELKHAKGIGRICMGSGKLANRKSKEMKITKICCIGRICRRPIWRLLRRNVPLYK
jgi:hypothetical protein